MEEIAVTDDHQKYQDGDQNDRFELLIFSEAGKPVYSYTKREDAVTLMPLCSALIEYAKKTQKETLHSIRTHDNLVIRFFTRSPLVIIVINETTAYVDTSLLVDQVEAQLVSILTAKTLNSVFKERPTFDLKRFLHGSEKLIDATANLCAFPNRLSHPWVAAFLTVGASTHLGSGPQTVMIPIVIMPQSSRDTMHSILKDASNSKNMVFSLLFNTDANSCELMTICNHHDRHKIKTADVHIIMALLCGSRAQLASVESLWMPLCLPCFNKDAFVHAYIAYMNGNRHCIVMISIDRDEFFNCQRSSKTIEDKLENLSKEPVFPVLQRDLCQSRHLQFLWYQTSKHVLWWQRSSQKSLDSVLYYVMKKMLASSLKHLWLKLADDTTFLGWHVSTFQMYVKFDGAVTTNEAAEVIQRITNSLKKEEESFTIKDYR